MDESDAAYSEKESADLKYTFRRDQWVWLSEQQSERDKLTVLLRKWYYQKKTQTCSVKLFYSQSCISTKQPEEAGQQVSTHSGNFRYSYRSL